MRQDLAFSTAEAVYASNYNPVSLLALKALKESFFNVCSFEKMNFF